MTYEQSTGNFLDSAGNLIGVGYSGNGPEMNSPESQNVRDHGPLPQGWYTVEPPHVDEQTGPVSMNLVPDPGNEMFGRSAFLIHGDNAALDHTASDGCIVMAHEYRVAIAAAVLAGDNRLQVGSGVIES